MQKIIPKNVTNKNTWPCIGEGYLSDVLVRAFATALTALVTLLIQPLFLKWGIGSGQYLIIVLIAGLPIIWLFAKLLEKFVK